MTSYLNNAYYVLIFWCFEKFLANTLFLPSFIVVRHQMGAFCPQGVSRTPYKIRVTLRALCCYKAKCTVQWVKKHLKKIPIDSKLPAITNTQNGSSWTNHFWHSWFKVNNIHHRKWLRFRWETLNIISKNDIDVNSGFKFRLEYLNRARSTGKRI